MRFFLAAILATWLFFPAFCQWQEFFGDDPGIPCCTAWSGDTDRFAVDASERLQLRGSTAGGVATLCRPLRCIEQAFWRFDVWMDFNPSAFNYADIYLVSDVPAGEALVYGYFVRIGYSTDEISLYRRDGDRLTKIIDGADGVTTASSVAMQIEVARSDDGVWDLYRTDIGGSGVRVHEGTRTDSTYVGNNFFGIQCRYTTTRRSGFYFDNILVEGGIPADDKPPALDTLVVTGPRHIDLHFSEPVFAPVALLPANYIMEGVPGHPEYVGAVAPDQKIWRLEWQTALEEDSSYSLTIHRAADVFFNASTEITWHFVYKPPYQPSYRDVVINEIFADPVPQQGLPDHEYVELHNTTDKSIHVGGWVLRGTGSKPIPEALLLGPGAYLLMVNERDVPYWEGRAVAWGTGGLLNGGESLALVTKDGAVMDSLRYDMQWYRDTRKDNGGWSLEQVNPEHCSSDSTNWRVAVDSAGGTPLRKNSVYDKAPDRQPPQLLAAGSAGVDRIQVHCSEWIDPASLDAGGVVIEPPVSVHSMVLGETAHTLSIGLDSALVEGTQYTVTLRGIADCSGNEMSTGRISFVQDGTSPSIREILVFNDRRVGVLFSEKIDEKTVSAASQIILTPPAVAAFQTSLQSDSLLIVDFDAAAEVGNPFRLSVHNIGDMHGNMLLADSMHFRWTLPAPVQFNELIVTEVMADPVPEEGLPAWEYIELYNRSGRRLLAADIMLGIGKNVRTIPAVALDADQFVVLCPSAGGELFRMGNKMLLTDWKALNNGRDTLTLYNQHGAVVFNVSYEDTWYQAVHKMSGGWSLEMIDFSRPCAGKDNWTASNDRRGGTPGGRNSVSAWQPDRRGPAMLSAFAIDPVQICVRFNEKLHPNSVHGASIAILPEGNGVFEIGIGPLLDEILVKTADSLETGVEYTISVDNVTDCNGNLVTRAASQLSVILPAVVDSLDVVINEVLYDPRPGGVEFVELYNRSGKHLDMHGWILALERDGTYYRTKEIAAGHVMIGPGAYLVLTTEPYTLKADYPSGKLDNFFAVDGMPPLSDAGSTLVLVADHGGVLDRFSYRPSMHHAWLDDPEGVSLERISTEAATNDAGNWSSAARDHGYATPGLRNSQFHISGLPAFDMSVEPDILIPGGGPQSVANLSYSCGMSGLMASVRVYDISGRCVKIIAGNANLGREGSFQWYGRDMHGAMVSMGYYVVVVELFGPDGFTAYHKETIAVARDFYR